MHADYLEKLIDAASEGDWRRALSIAHSLAEPAKISVLVANPLLGLHLTRISFHAGHPLNRELSRLFGKDLGTGDSSSATFPEELSRAVFSAGLARAEVALQSDNWAEIAVLLHMLTLLPSISSDFGPRLVAIVDQIVDRWREAQKELLFNGPPPHWRSDSVRTPFDSTPRLFSIISQSEYHPELAAYFLRSILQFAESPILRRLDAKFLVTAWPELVALVQDRVTRKNLTESARDWLERATAADPEPYAPGEFDEGEET